MRLSTRGNYGVRAAYELARNYGQGPVTVKFISEKQDIPVSYLEQLLVRLRRSGLIKSIRGPGGGYMLSKAPSQLSVGEVIRVLEGPVALSSCTDGFNEHLCGRGQRCVSKMLWTKVGKKIEEVLNSTSLADLCDMFECQ